MIRIRLTDHTEVELPPEEAKEVLRPSVLFHSPLLKEDYSALFLYEDTLTPVLGPVPATFTDDHWVIVCDEGAYVIDGLPQFLAAKEEESNAAPLQAA